MISRLIDILIGVVIGVTGQMLLFPKTLLICLRQNYARFWSDAEVFDTAYCCRKSLTRFN